MNCYRAILTELAILLALAGLFHPRSAADFSGDGRSSPMEIPLVVVLWQDKDFRGVKRAFIRDDPNLGEGWTKGATCQAGAKFEGASAVGVHPGPVRGNASPHSGLSPRRGMCRPATHRVERQAAGTCNTLSLLSLGSLFCSARRLAPCHRFETGAQDNHSS